MVAKSKCNAGLPTIATCKSALRKKVQNQLTILGLSISGDGDPNTGYEDKEAIREMHRIQRENRIVDNATFISRRSSQLIQYFASGVDVNAASITPVLERVYAPSWQSDLFRFAALTWSIPVSNGFGRRLRYLVWDAQNDKLIGLIAIGDPVFNLAVRDNLIGWNVRERAARLVNVMDAYVLGAVPPYNALLAGKAVACLVRSREIYDEFVRTYGNRSGIISGQQKKPRLLAVTTTSALGRSSVYNRLKLDGTPYFKPIGYTRGWGHFHIPDDLFLELREYLRKIGHRYADLHRFGQGPNWRLRTTRAALRALGLKDNLLLHGVKREVFYCQLASNATTILRTGTGQPELSTLLCAREIGELALDRWLLPRAHRSSDFRYWANSSILQLLDSARRNDETNVASGTLRSTIEE